MTAGEQRTGRGAPRSGAASPRAGTGGCRVTPGSWDLDPERCRVEATIRHAVLAKVRGRFPVLAGTVHVAAAPEDSAVEATIGTTGIDTGDATRDEHLRAPGFLDVARYPRMTFHSSGVRATSGERWSVHGELTIRDRTRPVVLTVSDGGVFVDPGGRTRARFSARTELAREEFGLSWNQTLETGGLLLGRTVAVELAIEAVLRPEMGR